MRVGLDVDPRYSTVTTTDDVSKKERSQNLSSKTLRFFPTMLGLVGTITQSGVVLKHVDFQY